MGKLLAILMLPLIFIDCVGNVVLAGGSFRNTLSGEAWHQRDHKYWGWCHRFIDKLFFWQQDHCRINAWREAAHGSVWAAWVAYFEVA